MKQQAKIQRLKEAVEIYKKIDTALTSREEREFELWVDDLIEIAEAKADRDRVATALEEIRVEIKAMFPPSGNWMYDEGYEHEHTVCEVLGDVLQIIDKHRKGEE